MKKKIVVLLSLVMILSMLLCGCGKNNNATVITNSGVTEEYQIEELVDTLHENEVLTENEYIGAEITLTGVVQFVESDYHGGVNFYDELSPRPEIYIVKLEGYAQVVVVQSEHPEVATLRAGDVIEIKSQIKDTRCLNWQAVKGFSMFSAEYIDEEWNDTTVITLQ